MRLERGSSNDGSSDALLTEALRAVYAPPADPGYWGDLEARVMARVKQDDGAEWWAAFDGWARVGLVAAGLVAVLAGVATFRARQQAVQVAYEATLETPSGVPLAVQTTARRPGPSERDATLQYVISY